MNSLIESLNVWGARFYDFALPILWQSSLLIAIVFAVDFLLRRKIRPAVRYTLWFVVFIKLLIPPTLALPTGAAWWLRTRRVEVIAPQPRTVMVSYSEPTAPFVPQQTPTVHHSAPPPRLTREAWILLSSICVSALLGGWSVFRWRQIARCVRKTTAASGDLQDMFAEICSRAGVRKIVRLQLTGERMSPAVCGLFRPVVLLPQSLVERLDRNQLRAVLLHELIHLRRRDVWVNCAQTLLQIVYWWHPLLWFANARMRRVREEAVDDAVMFALSEEAEIYAPTLLEVAKLAFNRPLATLGLVGILESRNALRHRIERLLNFTAPRRVGVSVMSVLGIAAFTALAVPMGEPPARAVQSERIADSEKLITYHAKVNPAVFIRNVQARAAGTMHTTNDDLTDILASILDGFGVDCTPPRNIAFDPTAGEVTLENTSEALQTADSVIRELNLAGGEDVLNPPYGLKQVLVVAQFYRMRAADFSELHLDSSRSHHERDISPWWDLTANELDNFRQEISTVRAEHLSSPRIQTSHGVTAMLSIGDKTNGIEFECVPYIHNGSISLTALARTTGNFAPEGGWPDFAGRTNCAIFSRFEIPDGGAVVLRAESAGAGAASDLVILLRANTVETTRSKDKVPFLGDLPGVGRLFRSDSNAPPTELASPTSTPTPDNRVDMINVFVNNGKSLYELGHLDEAQLQFEHALVLQPENQVARYYINLIMQAKVDAQLPKFPNPYARTNIIRTGAARQKIYEKMKEISFFKISYPDMPLSEVVHDLTERARAIDSEQEGVNILINLSQFDSRDAQSARTNDIDLGSVKIKVNEELRGVRLLDVLDAIVKSADHPIKYSLLDYGIEFSFKGPDTPELHTRTFKLDPNTFFMGLQGVTGVNFVNTNAHFSTATNDAATQRRGSRFLTSTDNTDAIQIQFAVVNFFDKIGVNLAAPKSVFYSERLSTLTVHATDADLELIEQAINTLNIAPPEVTIKVRFVEVDAEFLDILFMNGVGVSTNVVWTGILTEPKFKPILKSLEKRDHATLLNEGEVTTLSGRQAQLQIVDVMTVLNGVNATETNKAMTYSYAMTNMEFGTVLDIRPTIAADGHTIQMTIVPTVTEFLGYEDPKNYLKYDKNLKDIRLPLPKSRVRQVTTSAIVWDGQTLVLGNLGDESVVTEPDGTKLRQPFNDKKKKKLIVFITPTIIDPSGNRIHPDDIHSKDYYDGPTY